MKLEAIIISVNYLDFLSITLPLNLKHFDNVIVVTDNNDKETSKFCESLKADNLTVVKTDAFTLNGAKFNKGLAINVGFSYLKYKDFVFNLDSDIILPDDFREKLEEIELDKDWFYGFRRYDLPTQKDWLDYKENKKLDKYLCFRGSGYGYAALFNYNSKIFQNLIKEHKGFPYPYWFRNGSESDWVFRNNWGERVFSPSLGKFPDCHLEENDDYDVGLYKELDIRVLHLGEVGRNHNERVSEKFNE